MDDAAWRVHEVEPDLRVREVRPMPVLAATVDAEVSRLWDAAQRRMGGRLFNGRVFSADEVTPALVTGHWTEFRRVVARMDRPDIAADLPVRPLAAGGVIIGGDFVVFGRRPDGAVYQAGEWQLPPAGSLDPGAAREGGFVDPVAQVHAELAEELGMPADSVSDARALCIVEHPGSGVLDLGIALRTRWDREAIRGAHAARGNGEYDPLELVAPAELSAFLLRHAGNVTRQSWHFLARAGLIAAGE